MGLFAGLIRFQGFCPLGPSGEAFSGVCNLPQRFPFKLFRGLPISSNLHGATIEEGTTFNGKRLVVNIANGQEASKSTRGSRTGRRG
jgi:hypothetical protein